MDKLKERIKQADWWEITYLIIYGSVFTFEFLNTTMFEIKWPPRFGYIFLASTALYTIAKFIWHNTYTKKEMIWAGIILFAFLMPALLTEYRFLWYTGFLIVSAKDVEFDKILKVYLVIGITIMVAAFGASQMGWVENLVYAVWRDDLLVYRNSYGIVYPTDFAAHVFYLAIAGVCIIKNKLTYGVIINFVVLAAFVLDKCDARTSSICLLIMAGFLLFIKLLKPQLKWKLGYYVLNAATIGFASMYLVLTHIYEATKDWLVQLNDLLSNRLAITNKAVSLYDYQMFGQNITEKGFGRGTQFLGEYFFLDDSYIRIALMYGVVLLVVVLIMFWNNGVNAIKNKQIIILCAIAVIGLHSFMEHHILEIAYNPLLCYTFAKCGVDLDKLEVSNVS